MKEVWLIDERCKVDQCRIPWLIRVEGEAKKNRNCVNLGIMLVSCYMYIYRGLQCVSLNYMWYRGMNERRTINIFGIRG